MSSKLPRVSIACGKCVVKGVRGLAGSNESAAETLFAAFEGYFL